MSEDKVNTMAKLNIEPKIVFAPFKKALGSQWEKVCNDTRSFLGRQEQNIKSDCSDWKVSAKGVLKSKEGHELSLPLNSPISTLIRFGMQLTEIAKAADFGGKYEYDDVKKKTECIHCGMDVDIPQFCKDWLVQEGKEEKKEEAKKEKTEVKA